MYEYLLWKSLMSWLRWQLDGNGIYAGYSVWTPQTDIKYCHLMFGHFSRFVRNCSVKLIPGANEPSVRIVGAISQDVALVICVLKWWSNCMTADSLWSQHVLSVDISPVFMCTRNSSSTLCEVLSNTDDKSSNFLVIWRQEKSKQTIIKF